MDRTVTYMIISLVGVAIIAISAFFITKAPHGNSDIASQCIDACNRALSQGRNLAAGPCLMNPMTNVDWVCDVAHNPRQDVDNDPANQCDSYRMGVSTHFVEVTPDCVLIRMG